MFDEKPYKDGAITWEMQMAWLEAWKKGFEEGFAKGFAEGRTEVERRVAKALRTRGETIEEIASILKKEVVEVEAMLKDTSVQE